MKDIPDGSIDMVLVDFYFDTTTSNWYIMNHINPKANGGDNEIENLQV